MHIPLGPASEPLTHRSERPGRDGYRGVKEIAVYYGIDEDYPQRGKMLSVSFVPASSNEPGMDELVAVEKRTADFKPRRGGFKVPRLEYDGVSPEDVAKIIMELGRQRNEQGAIMVPVLNDEDVKSILSRLEAGKSANVTPENSFDTGYGQIKSVAIDSIYQNGKPQGKRHYIDFVPTDALTELSHVNCLREDGALVRIQGRYGISLMTVVDLAVAPGNKELKSFKKKLKEEGIGYSSRVASTEGGPRVLLTIDTDISQAAALMAQSGIFMPSALLEQLEETSRKRPNLDEFLELPAHFNTSNLSSERNIGRDEPGAIKVNTRY